MKGFDHHHKSNYINVIIRSLYEEVKSRRVFWVTAGNDQFVLSFSSSKWYFQSKIKVILFYAGWQYIVLYLDAGLSTGGIDVIDIYHILTLLLPPVSLLTAVCIYFPLQ